MKLRKYIGLAVIALVGGCFPAQSLYQWSLDGKWMSVLGVDNSLNFADANGNLTGVSIPACAMDGWFPDSKRLLVGEGLETHSWKELTPHLTAEQIQSITTASQSAMELMRTFDWGDPAKPKKWDDFTAALKAEESKAGHDTKIYDLWGGAVGIYAREHADEALRARIPPVRMNELMQVTQTICLVQVYTFDPSGVQAGPILMTLRPDQSFAELRVSPTGRAAIIALEDSYDEKNNMMQLWLVDTDGSKPAVKVEDHGNGFPDWSPDGQNVVYERQLGNLGTLSRVKVADSDGRLLDKFGGPEDLVGMVYDQDACVRCLNDGQIVFSATQMTLPATAGDIPPHGELFSITPGKQATVSRLVPLRSFEQIGDDADQFEISPDGRFASIPDGTDKVMVLELATGAVTLVQPKEYKDKDGHNQLLTVPQWRSSPADQTDELTFAAPSEKKGRYDVILWPINAKLGQILSANWPDKLVKD